MPISEELRKQHYVALNLIEKRRKENGKMILWLERWMNWQYPKLRAVAKAQTSEKQSKLRGHEHRGKRKARTDKCNVL